jgi:thiamine biosynthesis lipoprotein
MGALADLWGFGPAGPQPFPADAAVAEALACSGHRHIEQDGARARRSAPVALDFSGIAKGYAVDAVADRLRGLGLADFLVEIGGELRGEGIKPDGQPWWVDCEAVPGVRCRPAARRAPRPVDRHVGRLSPRLHAEGRRYAHTIDPRTGRPLENHAASVSVLHPSCMHADAWATGMARARGLAVRMLVRGGGEYLSPAEGG